MNRAPAHSHTVRNHGIRDDNEEEKGEGGKGGQVERECKREERKRGEEGGDLNATVLCLYNKATKLF